MDVAFSLIPIFGSLGSAVAVGLSDAAAEVVGLNDFSVFEGAIGASVDASAENKAVTVEGALRGVASYASYSLVSGFTTLFH